MITKTFQYGILLLFFSLLLASTFHFGDDHPHGTPTPPIWDGEDPLPFIESAALQGNSEPGYIEVPVLQIGFYPKDSENPQILDRTETGWGSPEPYVSRWGGAHFDVHTSLTIETWKEITDLMAANMAEIVSGATAYHRYKENPPGRGKYLEYTIYEQFYYEEAMPVGQLMYSQTSPPLTHNINGVETTYTGGGTVNNHRPNYNQILSDLPNGGICHYVDELGIREVWIYGYHADMVVPEGDSRQFIVPDESKLSSKYGDISNAWPKDESVADEFKLPICETSYAMYNFTYQPGAALGNTIHNRMHQLENVIYFAENLGYPVSASNPIYKQSVFWNDFSFYQYDFLIDGYRASCGNAHFPPNNTAQDQEYRYDIRSFVYNNCESWHIDDSLTTYELENCEQWGCDDVGFYVWFMQNLPGWQNGIVDEDGCEMRNWWELMADFDLFIDKSHSLWSCPDNPIETLEETLGLVTPTASSTVASSSTPTETLIPSPTPTSTETLSPTETAASTEVPSPTSSPTLTGTPLSTITPAFTSTAVPTETGTPTAESTPTGSRTPLATETPISTPEATVVPTVTPTVETSETPVQPQTTYFIYLPLVE